MPIEGEKILESNEISQENILDRDIDFETTNLQLKNLEGDDGGEKKGQIEQSFTFKPIRLDIGGSTIKNGEKWADGITTKVEFAGGSEHTSLYGYVRKDWNEYVKGFNEGMELFGNENIHLGKNIDLNGKQFYWGNGKGKLLAGPQISTNQKIGKVGIGGSVGTYAAYDIIPGQENNLSGSGIASVNISVEQKDGKKWTGDAFIQIGGMKDFNYENYSTYGEANIRTPNLLKDPKAVGSLSGWIFARYGGNIKNIKLSCLGIGTTISF